jgi:hypothetical protein
LARYPWWSWSRSGVEDGDLSPPDWCRRKMISHSILMVYVKNTILRHTHVILNILALERRANLGLKWHNHSVSHGIHLELAWLGPDCPDGLC